MVHAALALDTKNVDLGLVYGQVPVSNIPQSMMGVFGSIAGVRELGLLQYIRAGHEDLSVNSRTNMTEIQGNLNGQHL